MSLREVLADLAVKVSGTEKLKAADSGIKSFTDNLETGAKLLAGGAFLAGVRSFVGGLVEQGSALNDASQALGINVDDLESWQFAAKLNGVEAGELTASLTKLQKNMIDNAQGGAESGGEFQKLGVALRDVHGNVRDTTEVLYDTGLAISKLPKGAEQTAAAMEVFGKAGKKLLPMFADGEQGLNKYLDEVKNLGGGIGGAAVEQLDDLGDNMDRLSMATTSAKVRFLSAFLPALIQGVQWITKTVVALGQNKQALGAVAIAAGAVGAAFAVAGLEAVAPWIPMLLLFSALLLVAQDFYVGLNGGKSVIKDTIDQLFGKGAGESFFAEVKKDAQELLTTLKAIIDAIKTVKDLGKLKTDFNAQLDAEKQHDVQAKGSGTKGGYLTGNEAAQRQSYSEDRIESIGRAKQALASMQSAWWGQGAFGTQLSPEQIPTEDAEKLVDKLVETTGQAKFPDTIEDLSALISKLNHQPDPSDLSDARGGSSKGGKPTQISATNNVTQNFTIKSSDRADVTEGVSDATGEALGGQAAQLRQVVEN